MPRRLFIWHFDVDQDFYLVRQDLPGNGRPLKRDVIGTGRNLEVPYNGYRVNGQREEIGHVNIETRAVKLLELEQIGASRNSFSLEVDRLVESQARFIRDGRVEYLEWFGLASFGNRVLG